MSGWRRRVPVPEQGASSRMASNFSAGVHLLASDVTSSAERPARARFSPSRVMRRAGDVDGGHLRAGGAELHGLAAGRGAEVGDALAGDVAQQARGQGGGGVLHPPGALGEARQVGDVAAARWRRRVPVGSDLGFELAGPEIGIASAA